MQSLPQLSVGGGGKYDDEEEGAAADAKRLARNALGVWVMGFLASLSAAKNGRQAGLVNGVSGVWMLGLAGLLRSKVRERERKRERERRGVYCERYYCGVCGGLNVVLS